MATGMEFRISDRHYRRTCDIIDIQSGMCGNRQRKANRDFPLSGVRDTLTERIPVCILTFNIGGDLKELVWLFSNADNPIRRKVQEIGRASCRERVKISWVAATGQ